METIVFFGKKKPSFKDILINALNGCRTEAEMGFLSFKKNYCNEIKYFEL